MMNKQNQFNDAHGCRKCAEVMQGYTEDELGVKWCNSCTVGKVYSLQEVFDLLKELDLSNEGFVEELHDRDDDYILDDDGDLY